MWQICKLMSKLSDCSIERNEVPPLVSRRQVGVELWAESQFNGSNPVISHRPNWAADPACLNIQYCTLSAPRSNKQRYGTIAIRNIHETAAMEMILLFEKFTAFSRPIVPKIMATTVSVFMESKYLAVLVTRSQTGREEGEDKKVLIINFLIINNIFYTF